MLVKVITPASSWKRDLDFLLALREPSRLSAGRPSGLGCSCSISSPPMEPKAAPLGEGGWTGNLGRGGEEAVGARNTLTCGLISLWSLFPNCPSLQKDTVKWWGEVYHLVPSSCGRAHCATGHWPTKDQCVPSTNPHLPSQSFPLPQFSLQKLLGIGNKVPSVSPSSTSLFSRLCLWKWKAGMQT